MSLHNILNDYSAANGDFGGGTGTFQAAPPPQIPQVPQAPIVTPGLQQQVGQQAAPQNPLAGVADSPLFQFIDQWKKSSPEMKKSAEAKIEADLGSPKQAFGVQTPQDDLDEALTAKKKVEAEKLGKTVADKGEKPGGWGRFMKYIDANPQFLLDVASKLLAPRDATQSDLGFAVGGINTAVQAAEARRAASAKSGLEGQKTAAEIGQIKADTGKVDSEIELNFAKAYGEYQSADEGEKPAAKVQLLQKITDALWATGGPDKGGKYATRDEATLGAQRIITGKGTPEENAYYKFLIDNQFTGGTAADANAMLSGAPSPTNIRAQEEGKQAEIAKVKSTAEGIIKNFGGDRLAMREAFMKAKNLSIEQADGAVAQIYRNAGTKLKDIPAPAKRTLAGDLKANEGVKVLKAEGKEEKKKRKAMINRWDNVLPPSILPASARNKRAAKRAMKEIEKVYDSLPDSDKDRVLKMYNRFKDL